ncbi:MAG: SRPBCC domain-containing protein [Acidimicrobiales bacterium]
MTVTSVEKFPETHAMVVTAEFAASIEAVWAIWSDPRQLERWWGPPMYPATFVGHNLVPDAVFSYYMTSPEGDQYHGWWKILEVDEGRRIKLEEGFADADGNKNPDLPVTVMVTELREGVSGTVMQLTSTFASLEAMEQLISMGMEEGLVAAMGQVDDILA